MTPGLRPSKAQHRSQRSLNFKGSTEFCILVGKNADCLQQLNVAITDKEELGVIIFGGDVGELGDILKLELN